MSLPAHVRAEVQRILDAEARRLLADEHDSHASDSATRADIDTLHGCANERPPRLDGQPIPVRGTDPERHAA